MNHCVRPDAKGSSRLCFDRRSFLMTVAAGAALPSLAAGQQRDWSSTKPVR